MTTQPVNRSAMTDSSQEWLKWTPWISRLVLILPALLLIMISFRFILDPAHAIAATGITFSTPEALTDTRVFGGITLTVVLILTSAIFSRRGLRMGHAAVIALMTLVLSVRLFGFMQDGTTLAMGTQKMKTTGEIIFLALNAVGFALQTYGRKRME